MSTLCPTAIARNAGEKRASCWRTRPGRIKLHGKFLLVHGLADDNVHFQNSAEMVSALVKANKQFDFMAYPDKNHGIYGGNTRVHLYTKMTDFLLEDL